MRLSRGFRTPRQRFLNAESVCGTGSGRTIDIGGWCAVRWQTTPTVRMIGGEDGKGGQEAVWRADEGDGGLSVRGMMLSEAGWRGCGSLAEYVGVGLP